MTTRYARLGVTIMTDGTRQTSAITLANVQDLVAAYTAAFPGIHLTWNLDDGALDDSTGSWGWLRSYVADRVANHGDAAAYWRKFGFPGTDPATENSIMDSYMPKVQALGGPSLASGWYIPVSTLAHLRSSYGVKTVWGQCWSQHNVDGFSGDGSPNCPYFPSSNHALIPAQVPADALDVLVCDNYSQDFFGAKVGARTTIDPADAGGVASAEKIAHLYLDDAYTPGDIRWISHHTQVDYYYSAANSAALANLKSLISWLGSTYPTMKAVNLDEFGTAWRARYPTNSWAIAQSQTDPGGSGDTIYWLHTAKARRGLYVTSGGTMSLLDLTRYSDSTVQPATPSLTVEPPALVNQRDSFHPLNPTTIASYGEMAGLFKTFPALGSHLR